VELNSGNLGSRCEAVIAVLQGLMSSEVERVPGGVTGDVTGLELAEVCQQSHVSVTGRNNASLSPVHLAHLPMSPPPHVLPTSLASSRVSQVGLLLVHAAHLTTSQLGLTPVSQWMVCMARCGEVCNRGK